MGSTDKKLKILVVDDDGLIREMIVMTLQDLNHEVVAEAANGQEAVDLFRQHQPDLTLMDIEMPVMTGITAVKEIHKITPNATIVMLSGTPPEETMEYVFDAGADDFICKNDDFSVVQQEIESMIKKLF